MTGAAKNSRKSSERKRGFGGNEQKKLLTIGICSTTSP
jgi:hypothetical protein